MLKYNNPRLRCNLINSKLARQKICTTVPGHANLLWSSWVHTHKLPTLRLSFYGSFLSIDFLILSSKFHLQHLQSFLRIEQLRIQKNRTFASTSGPSWRWKSRFAYLSASWTTFSWSTKQLPTSNVSHLHQQPQSLNLFRTWGEHRDHDEDVEGWQGQEACSQGILNRILHERLTDATPERPSRQHRPSYRCRPGHWIVHLH